MHINSLTTDKIFLYFFFAISLFCSTFSIAISQLSLGIALVLFVKFSINNKIFNQNSILKKIYLIIIIYILWNILAEIMTKGLISSLNIFSEEWLFLMLPIGVFVLAEAEIRDKIFSVLAVGVILISLYGILQYFTGVTFFKDATLTQIPEFGYRAAGNFHTLTFANYFGIAAIFFIVLSFYQNESVSSKQKILFRTAGMTALTAVILSLSRGALFGLFIVSIFSNFYLKGKMKLTALIIFGVLIAGFAALPGMSDRFIESIPIHLAGEYEGGRGFIWKHTLEIIADNPIWGIGHGNFMEIFLQYVRPDLPKWWHPGHAHNDYLQISAVSGIPALIIFLTMYFHVAFSLFKSSISKDFPKNGILTASFLSMLFIIIISLSNDPFQDDEVRYLIMFIWAAGLSVIAKHSGTSESLDCKKT